MLRSLLIALALIAASSQFASAFVPSAGNSTVPTCIQVVPGGFFVTTVIVRDVANNPIPGSTVALSYANCPGLAVCTAGLPDAYVHNPTLKMIFLTTNSVGSAQFYLRAGGGCAASDLQIFADGVLLGSARVVSADQNGDLVVNGTDVALEQAKIGTLDLSGDLNCDGVVDSSDLDEQHRVLGETCSDPTPVRPRSWGGLKLIYR